MDTYEGPARLEWWANPATCLGSIDVRVLVVSDEAGWRVSAAVASPMTSEGRGGLEVPHSTVALLHPEVRG